MLKIGNDISISNNSILKSSIVNTQLTIELKDGNKIIIPPIEARKPIAYKIIENEKILEVLFSDGVILHYDCIQDIKLERDRLEVSLQSQRSIVISTI